MVRTPVYIICSTRPFVGKTLIARVLSEYLLLAHGAAVAFAHVRRPGPPNPVATRVDGGWLLDGTLDWVTSWDIADVVMVMAHAPSDDLLVCCYLPAGRAVESTPGVTAGPVLPLLASPWLLRLPLSPSFHRQLRRRHLRSSHWLTS